MIGATLTEPARETPVRAQTEVAVVGGGPSGFIAAIAAARTGARTLLLEHHGFLGGMATAALVGPMSKFNSQGRRIVRGIPEEFVNRLGALGGARTDLPSGNIPFDAELYKRVAREMVEEAGVELRLHSQYCGVVNPREQGADAHLLAETKAGREAIATRLIVDCTGSAEVVAGSGLPWCYRSGPEGELQPLSLMFRLGGVETGGLQEPLMAQDGTRYFNRRAREALEQAVAAGRLGQFGGPWLVYGSTLRPGEVTVNATRIGLNVLEPGGLSRAESALQRDMWTILDVLRHAMPELKDAYLMESATQAGIRETRSIIGPYTLTGEDLLAGRDFEDTVAYGAHPVDIHRAGTSSQEVHFVNAAYGIPFRTLVPRGSAHLLVAGGSLSATREAFASARVQAQCMALGQAAGTAAALCVKEGLPVHALEGARLRDRLRREGACVDRPGTTGR